MDRQHLNRNVATPAAVSSNRCLASRLRVPFTGVAWRELVPLISLASGGDLHLCCRSP
jgi:hypothetical protein